MLPPTPQGQGEDPNTSELSTRIRPEDQEEEEDDDDADPCAAGPSLAPDADMDGTTSRISRSSSVSSASSDSASARGLGQGGEASPTRLAEELVLLGHWRPTWCLPECLVRMAEVWEALGVTDKAAGYFEKARVVAARWGAGGVERRAVRGKGRVTRRGATAEVVREEKETQEASKEEGGLDQAWEGVRVWVGKGDEWRGQRQWGPAREAYDRAEERRRRGVAHRDLVPVLQGGQQDSGVEQEREEEQEGDGSRSRWRDMAAAVMWRQAWAG